MRVLGIWCFLLLSLFAQQNNGEQEAIYAEKVKSVKESIKLNSTISDMVQISGERFLGVDYVAHTLENSNDEELIVSLNGLDCTTFLETSVAMAKSVKESKTDYGTFTSNLQKIRYRNGVIKDYTSRLHYFSDWIYENEMAGTVSNLSKELSGEKIRFEVGFMSKNPDKYKHLKSNPGFVKVIKEQEAAINSREYYYIPKAKVKSIENKVSAGNLIAITTSIKGLDIAHVGIAYRGADGVLKFMHAPDVGQKVQITKISLSEMVNKNKNFTGIIVLRVN